MGARNQRIPVVLTKCKTIPVVKLRAIKRIFVVTNKIFLVSLFSLPHTTNPNQ